MGFSRRDFEADTCRRTVVSRHGGLVKNVPWNLYANHAEADGDIPEDKAVDVEHGVVLERTGQAVPPVVVKTRQVAPRAFQIRNEDAEKYGYTRGCAGCSSWFRGLGRQPHSDECRDRFAKVMKEDAKYKNASRSLRTECRRSTPARRRRSGG